MIQSKIKTFITRNERAISAGALLAGLLIDAVTFTRIDELEANALILFYLCLVGMAIALLNLHETGRARWITEGRHLFLLVAMQFSFGGIFGRYLIYYGRSGAVSQSWPFLLLLIAILVANERVREHYTRLTLQVSLLFTAVLLYLAFIVPILVGQMGDIVFVASSAVALGIITLYGRLLAKIVPTRFYPGRRALRASVASILLVMNALYFTNSIPPIPLVLRTAGIYHTVRKAGDVYIAQEEIGFSSPWYARYPKIRVLPGGSLSAYSAVFAPAEFGASITHNWERYDTEKKTWVSENVVTFPITGGTDRGYRGYTIASDIQPGFWRVAIENQSQQVVGTIRFEAVEAKMTPQLVSKTL